MEFRQLRTFRTVATLLSFNRAAEVLHCAQSTVSAQILALEEDLQVKLFDRLGRRIVLTEAGRQLLKYAEKILDLANETRSEITGHEKRGGTLTVRIPETLGVHRFPPVIKQFHDRFPKARLRFITCSYEGLQRDLRKGITDLAFLLADSIQARDLAVEMLGTESVILVSHPDHPLTKKQTVWTKDMEGETILLSRVDCSYRKLFEHLLVEERVSPGMVLEFNSVAAITRCVQEGVGITLLPSVAARPEIEGKRLFPLPWLEGGLEVAVLMVWHKEKWISPMMASFMETVRACIMG